MRLPTKPIALFYLVFIVVRLMKETIMTVTSCSSVVAEEIMPPLLPSSNDSLALVVKAESNNTRFHPDKLDFSSYTPCGVEKCFFRQDKKSRFGYLVMQAGSISNTSDSVWQIGKESWKLARLIEKKYGARHLMGPVRLVNITDKIASRLNTNLVRENYQGSN